MAETVGRAEIDVDIDGRGLEQQVRALGQQIGKTLGRSLAQTFGRQMKQLSADMQKSMNEMRDSVDRGSRDMNGSIADLGDRFDSLGNEIRRSNETVRLWQIRAQESADDTNRLSDALDRNSHSWKSLPHGMRQAIFYVGLFASMAEEIAILGSAAGSGLTVLAGAAGALAVGVGVGIAAFQDLNSELSELPAAVQPAAAAFQAFNDQLSVLQDAIQAAAAPGIAAGFEALKTVVEELTPAFEMVGEVVGEVFQKLAESLLPGTNGFNNLNALIGAAAPVLRDLGDAFIKFGEALGDIFVASIPFVQQFAEWLSQIATQFAEWTNSIEGRNALQEWFENGATVMEAILPLVVAVADALNALVTPESIADFVEFLDTMTQFIPILGQILGVIGELNVFNVLAEILLVVGQALQPIIPQLMEFAAILSESLLYAITSLAEPLTNLMISLGPLLPLIAQIAAVILAAAVEAIPPLIDALAQIVPQLIPIFEEVVALAPEIVLLGQALGEILVAAVDAIVPLLPPLVDLIVLIIGAVKVVAPLLIGLAATFSGVLAVAVRLITTLIGALIDVVNAIIKPFVDMGKKMNETSGFTDAMSDAISDSMGMFEDWGNTIEDVVQGVIGWVQDAIGWLNDLFGLSASAPTPGSGSRGGGGGGFASGGIVNGAARRLTGEAGPEAIVPLNRPLSMVDPSVRALSAIAQGLSGGNAGPGKIVNVEAGAIVIETAAPPVQVASAVLDRLVANTAI